MLPKKVLAVNMVHLIIMEGSLKVNKTADPYKGT